MKRWTAVVVAAVMMAVAPQGVHTATQDTPRFLGPPQTGPDVRLNRAIDPVIDALWSAFDPDEALGHVRFLSQYWRLAGNPGFDLSIDRVRERLTEAGLATSVDEYPTSGPAWDYSTGTVGIVRAGAADEVVLSRERERLALCINSFSTPAGGVVARLVDVGRGDRDEDYAGRSIEGAVVLGDADVGQLWRRAVTARGAAGVISTALPSYLSADPPGARPTPRDEWDILQWGSVPYDATRRAFGFKASPRAAARLRQRLQAASGDVAVRVTVASTFSTGPARTLVAEIPGRVVPAERVVLAAHVQEPGANDNASGVATLAELAVALSKAINDGRIDPPGRTITFLFINEITGSRRWMQDHPVEAKGARYMLSLDMTGEDLSKTGGSFLVERYPDPGAVWDRPWDPHTEWGRGNVRADSLKGDLINDAHLAVCRRVARRTGWVVKTNPYEGGSDHTVFGNAGVPSVLDWHFTDRYYHTNLDTPDKTSPAEMRNVGVAAAATAWLFASATADTAIAVAEAVADAGQARVSQEETEGARLISGDRDPAGARAREATIVAAWKKWYAEAVRSASRLVVGPVTQTFTQSLDALAEQFRVSGGAPVGGLASSTLLGLVGLASGPPIRPIAAQGDPGFIVCGEDTVLAAPIPVRWTTAVLAGDGRLYVPCPSAPVHQESHREKREEALLGEALQSKDPEVRWRAAQASARLGAGLGRWLTPTEHEVTTACSSRELVFGGLLAQRRWQPGALFRMMLDRDARVRAEAAYAVGVQLAERSDDGDLVVAATTEAHACLAREKDPEVAGLLLEALGAARYHGDEPRAAAEALLLQETTRESPGSERRLLGAVKGLEALIRQSSQRPIALETRQQLRRLAVSGPRTASALREIRPRISRVALLALAAARDNDTLTLERAAMSADWQMRRLVAMQLNLSDEVQARLGEILAADQAFQVRYEVIGALAREATRTKTCAPLVKFFADPEPVVVLRAVDALNASCTDLEDGVAQLVDWADLLAKPESHTQWHLPSRALSALARVAPESARSRLPAAMDHAVWQVRAAAATACVALSADAEAVALANDREANVRTAALQALVRLKSPAVFEASIRALKESTDYQLVLTAAQALKGAPEKARDEAAEVLLSVMRQLTERADDTSRDPRVALLERLGEILRPERSADLLPFMADFDDTVNAAALKAFGQLVGSPAAVPRPRRRYPYQPGEDAIGALPTAMTMEFDQGTVQIRLLTDVATVSVARIAALVSSGYYNGLTFHRIVPNFVVQGGSPGANEYVGVSRYMRDEVGPQAEHLRGAVGVSTRGRDTGDGQLFIDLVDLPRLDRDYTVFGYVTEGMDIVDRLLDGAVVRRVSVR